MTYDISDIDYLSSYTLRLQWEKKISLFSDQNWPTATRACFCVVFCLVRSFFPFTFSTTITCRAALWGSGCTGTVRSIWKQKRIGWKRKLICIFFLEAPHAVLRLFGRFLHRKRFNLNWSYCSSFDTAKDPRQPLHDLLYSKLQDILDGSKIRPTLSSQNTHPFLSEQVKWECRPFSYERKKNKHQPDAAV